MFSIKNDVQNEIVINKSKFITFLFYVENINEINTKIMEIKNEYKDATHYCYGYIIGNNIKCSDDGEPSGTAGMPILNVLKNKNFNNILCIVVRYYGGVKLGAGGLIRAYSNACKEAITNSLIVTLEKGVHFKIIFSYKNSKQIDYILKNSNIINKMYNDNIIYEVIDSHKLIDELKMYDCVIKVIDNIFIKIEKTRPL